MLNVGLFIIRAVTIKYIRFLHFYRFLPISRQRQYFQNKHLTWQSDCLDATYFRFLVHDERLKHNCVAENTRPLPHEINREMYRPHTGPFNKKLILIWADF